MNKRYPKLGCCGLDCGLCPRYYTAGTSRCPGCCGPDFFMKHPSCPFITCCVKKNNLEVCGECREFPCPKFDRETGESDSFITHRNVMKNQNFIRKYGIQFFLEQQNKRTEFLQTLLNHYDDGNSKSFYCISCTLLPINKLDESIIKADNEIKDKAVDKEDLKTKAKILKEIFNQIALEENIELKLRKANK